ncbi:C3a anaphylatoxin chemotactic receptor-like [Centrocercus urophasianus]|uniref:C3a anaphylatoxin chemotactic receptor-like n=1 Tax=Centrocercus urophasianus TaxID=9002 RepID=UPI001C649F5E|nr:C3a anaphylatoxin chemotactic receptor-like [Centrocercus urophasianus]XP_042691084.1 C3a anaphylatoxin chemotactic receptor-like [Centrocercus urophasianus]XP_042691085.1 C3a anaphylatoxin chemotactic receptor-like [Centrocercus urophasianus]
MPPLLVNSSSHEQDAIYYAPESIGSLVIFILVFIIGIPGNGLVIWVAGLKMKRSVNIIWFLNLAVADFMCCLSLPFFIVHLFLNEHWPYGWFLCKVIPSVIIFTMFASVFLLMVISIDRCLLVMKPVWCQNHRTIKFISLLCSGIWILAFIFCCPVFHYRNTITDGGKTECGYNFGDYEILEYMDDSDPVTGLLEEYSPLVPAVTYIGTIFAHQPTDSYSYLDFQANSISTNKGIIAEAHLSHATVDVNSLLNSTAYPDIRLLESQSDLPNTNLPVPSNSDFNLKLLDPPLDLLDFDSVFSGNDYAMPFPLTVITITRAVFGFILPFCIMAVCYALIAFRMRASNYRKPQSKMLRTIILVVVAFFVCWAPYHIVGILSLVATPGTELKESLILWDHLSVALAYANSCINPLLYVFVGRDFRAKARQSLQGVLEGVFTEEPTCSSPYSADRSKTSKDKDVSTTV